MPKNKRITDLTDYTSVLPYASEMFGVYQPMIVLSNTSEIPQIKRLASIVPLSKGLYWKDDELKDDALGDYMRLWEPLEQCFWPQEGVADFFQQVTWDDLADARIGNFGVELASNLFFSLVNPGGDIGPDFCFGFFCSMKGGQSE